EEGGPEEAARRVLPHDLRRHGAQRLGFRDALRPRLLRHRALPLRDGCPVRLGARTHADPRNDQGGRRPRDSARREAEDPFRQRGLAPQAAWMRTRELRVRARDGERGAHVAFPERTPAGAIIAIMEIWGVNDTMRRHAQEFAQAGFVCLVPDLFWRQQPGVELSDRNPGDVKKAFDLYYDFDYDLGVRDMEDTVAFLKREPECNGRVGAVGY